MLPATADALAGTGIPAHAGMLWNGATWDRPRGPQAGVSLIASATRTATASSATQTNYGHKGVLVVVDVTAAPSNASTLTLAFSCQNPFAYIGFEGTLIINKTDAAVVATHGILIYPGIVAANIPAQDAGARIRKVIAAPLPRTWGVDILHNNSESWTYSVSAHLLT